MANRWPAPIRSRLRHQVWEIPEIKPLVTEYQLHRLTCRVLLVQAPAASCRPVCRRARPARGWSRSSALLMGCFKQSKRRVALFLEQVLNQPCSPGWVVKLQNQATAALTPAYEELAAQLPNEPVSGHRRIADERSPAQVVAVDVRRQHLHGLCAADHAGRDGPSGAAHGSLRRRGELRSGEDVLEQSAGRSGAGPI